MAPRANDRALVACGFLWLVADHAYYWLQPGASRAWLEHVFVHLAAGLAVWLLRDAFATAAWALVVWITVLNRAQSAACGAAIWAGESGAWVPGTQDLCVTWLGRDAYVAMASISGAAVIVLLTRRRPRARAIKR